MFAGSIDKSFREIERESRMAFMEVILLGGGRLRRGVHTQEESSQCTLLATDHSRFCRQRHAIASGIGFWMRRFLLPIWPV